LEKEKDPNNPEDNLLTDDIIIAATKYLLNLANNKRGYYEDDVDHLSNRRVRLFGEIMYNHLQPVFRRFAKSIRGKLSVLDLSEMKTLKITDLVNFKMIDNAIKSFFATSQLSQFLDQTNPLAELEHKRRLTALGPGGIKRETATFEVRDVHPSHYGRICPIETPEGHNIGLVIYQALYSRINEDGFLEVPAAKVVKEVEPKAEKLVNRIADEDIFDKKGNLIVKDGDYIDEKAAKKIEKEYTTPIKIRPYVSDEIEYISPEKDEKYYIADITIPLDEHKNILAKRVPGRHYYDMEMYHVNDITHVDVDPSCIFSANTSSISFVDHNDPVRALMGTNMQRQAVPLIKPEAPLCGTGLEGDIAERTYAVKKAEDDGEVIYVDAKRVKVKYKKLGVKEYDLITFKKSNQKTLIHQVPKVSL
jgi:DNA-directed RNA polymerase subunit beta